MASKKPPVNKDQSLRPSSGKKQGAQEGHEGKNLSVTFNPDHVEKHMHSACNNCPYHDSWLEHACVKETRHEIDTVVKTSVTAHELIVVKTCPLHGGSRTDMGNPVQGTSPIIGGTGYPNGKSKDQGIRMLPLYGRCTGISYNNVLPRNCP